MSETTYPTSGHIHACQGDYCIESENAALKGDRDRWRTIAEGAREALGKAIIMLRCGGPEMGPCTSCDCKEALAAFPPPEKSQ